MIACKDRRKDVIQLLLDNSKGNINLNERNQWGQTAFMYACENGHKAVV